MEDWDDNWYVLKRFLENRFLISCYETYNVRFPVYLLQLFSCFHHLRYKLLIGKFIRFQRRKAFPGEYILGSKDRRGQSLIRGVESRRLSCSYLLFCLRI